MRIRHRKNKCLNCGWSISEVYNYCPNCGQENTTTNLSFGVLFKEFFNNYFSLDSRFGRSIKPFLIKPGALTIAFNEGKRVMYAHPIRLYLIISLFHFFLFSWVLSDGNDNTDVDIFEVTEEDRAELDSLMKLPPADRGYDEDSWPLQDWEMSLMAVMHEDEFADEVILDSLQVAERDLVDRFVIKRMLRLSDASGADLSDMIVENIPVMMFFILPLYALLLKLFYFRRGLYIIHVIHSLHIHSFLFFILGLTWLYELIFNVDEDILIFIDFILISLYIVLSFRRVYQQKWITTLFKFGLLGFAYSILLSISLLVEVLVSLALY